MRQMRLEKREIKDPAELEKVLDACKVVRIGTMDAEGMFIVPVNFGYEFCQKERGLKLYIHSAKEGRKAEAFAENPNVAIEMDCGHEVIRGDYTCSYSFAFSSIMGKRTNSYGGERGGKETRTYAFNAARRSGRRN